MEIEKYFDWAATGAIDEETAEILRKSLEESIEFCANPSSVHAQGRKARERLEKAREDCAKTLGVKSNQIFFTSGGTEGDHIPLVSMLFNAEKGRILTSGIEHSAIREMAHNLKRIGFQSEKIAVDENGFISADAVLKKLEKDTQFVSVMAVNNETGNVMPIYEIAQAILEKYNGKKKPHFHTDCVQAAGKIELSLNEAGIDSASISAHKLGGPRGTGILFLAQPQKFKAFLAGGGQENGIRSGTENLFGAIATAEILKKRFFLKGKENARLFEQKKLTKDFVDSLKKIPLCSLVPSIREKGEENFSPWIVQAAFKGIPGNVMVRALDAKGFCISTGSACSARKQNRPVLEEMGVSRENQETAVRFSFGHATTKSAMDSLLQAVREVCADFS